MTISESTGNCVLGKPGGEPSKDAGTVARCRKQISLCDASGLTLTGIVVTEAVALLFGDDRFTVLVADPGYSGCYPAIQEPLLELQDLLETFGRMRVIEAGLASEEQVAAYEREREMKRVALIEQSERETYERLRAKYEGK